MHIVYFKVQMFSCTPVPIVKSYIALLQTTKFCFRWFDTNSDQAHSFNSLNMAPRPFYDE